MKKLLSYMLVFCLCVLGGQLQAQTSASNQVNLIFSEIMEIKIGTGQENVSMDMNQVTHYLEGSTTGSLSNHIIVTSITGYEVAVKTSSSYLEGPTQDIPVATISLETVIGDDPGLANEVQQIQINPVNLGVGGSVLLSSPHLSIQQGFNVEYIIPADQTFEYLNRSTGSYSTTVQYTIIPK